MEKFEAPIRTSSELNRCHRWITKPGQEQRATSSSGWSWARRASWGAIRSTCWCVNVCSEIHSGYVDYHGSKTDSVDELRPNTLTNQHPCTHSAHTRRASFPGLHTGSSSWTNCSTQNCSRCTWFL